jgi:uncharacterized membrane protein
MKLGNLLDHTRQAHIGAWKTGLFVFLAALAAINLFVLPHEAEYGLDAYPEFWALFGLVTTLVMVWVMKKIVQPIIERHEEEETDD